MRKITSTKVFEILFLTLLFVTPLVFSTKTKEGFEFPKLIFVYFLGVTIVWIFTILRISNNAIKNIKLPNPAILAFVAINLLAGILSMHLYTSLWGYYSRFNDGIISLLVFIGLFIVITNTFKKSALDSIIDISIATILPISLFAIFQHLSNEGFFRAYASFGQPNWMAAYIVMLLPLVLNKALNTERRQFIVFASIFILGYSALWYSYSMSGLLGLMLALGYLIYLEREKFAKEYPKVLGLILAISLISITNLGPYKKRVQDVFIDLRKVSAQTEHTTKELEMNNISDPGFIRINMWKGAVGIGFSSPKVFLIGTGPETFPYAFQAHRPKDLNYSSEWDFILNKPHNYYLETFTETGILGLGTYLWVLMYSLRHKSNKYKPGLLGLYVTNVFGWPTVATSLLFWIFLASMETESK